MTTANGSEGLETPSDTPFSFTANANWQGLRVRTVSAVVLVLLLLIAELVGGILFTALIVLAGLFMIREWDALTTSFKPGWHWMGVIYVLIPCTCLIWLRNVQFDQLPEAGRSLVLYLMFSVWSTDIGAYFAGRSIGGPKLAPSISPNKTWAGLAGGALSAGIVGALCSFFTPFPATMFAAMVTAMLLAVVAQTGDLFESWLKRRAGVKDSGTLIPGHGGILDRIDGLIFATPVFTLLVAGTGLSV